MAEATTEVQVVPDFTGFVAAMRRGIDDSMRQVAAGVSAGLAPAVAQAAATGKKIADELAAGIGQGARVGAGGMVQPLAAGGAAGGRAAGTQFANAFVPQSQSAIKKVAGVLTTTFAGAALTATGLLGKSLTMGFQRATLIEDSQSAMNIILGSVQEADKLMAGVLETVTGTPFNLDQFADAAKTLVAFNIEADKVPAILDAIGTAAAASGRGAEGVGSLVNTFGQMAATGRVSLEDVWSISATGINALAILANHFGLTANAMKDMISEGSVPAAESIDALMKGIMEGSDGAAGRVRGLGGSMEALRKTVSGAVGGFRAAMARAGANLLSPVLAESPNTINRMSQALDAVSKRIGAVIKAAANSESFQQFLDSINGFLDRLAAKDGKFLDELSGQLERIAPLAAGAGAALTAMGANGLPFIGQFLPKINPLVAGIVAIATATPQGREALTNFAESLRPVIEDLVPKLTPLLEDLSTILSETFTAGFEAAAVAIKLVVTVVRPLLPAITALTGFIADNEAVVWGLVAAYTAWAVQARLTAAANAAAMATGGGAGAAGVAEGAAQAGMLTRLIGLATQFKKAVLFRMDPKNGGMAALPALLSTITHGFRTAAASAWLLRAGIVGIGVAIGAALGSMGDNRADNAISEHLRGVIDDTNLKPVINSQEDAYSNLEKLAIRREEVRRKIAETGSNWFKEGAERTTSALTFGLVDGDFTANKLRAELDMIDREMADLNQATLDIEANASKIGEALFESMPNDFANVDAATDAVKRYAEAKDLALVGDWDSEGVQNAVKVFETEFPKAAAAADDLGLSVDEAMTIDPELLEESMKNIASFVNGVRGMLQGEQSFLKILDEPVDPEQLADAMQAVRDAEADLARGRSSDAEARARDAEAAAERADRAAEKISDAQAKLHRATIANQRTGSWQSAQDMADAQREIAEAQREQEEAGRSSARGTDAAAAATDRLREARKRLAEVQESDSPFNAEKIRTHFEGLLANTQQFQADLDKAIQMGYSPTVIMEIMTAGPEEAGARLREMVGEHGEEIMGIVNAYYKALEDLNVKLLEQARIFASATDPNVGSAEKTKWAAKASQVSSTLLDAEAKNEKISKQELAFYLGISESDLDNISKLFDLNVDERLGAVVGETYQPGAPFAPQPIPTAPDRPTVVPPGYYPGDVGYDWTQIGDMGERFRAIAAAFEVEADTSKAEEDIADMAERFGAIAAAFEVEADTSKAEEDIADMAERFGAIAAAFEVEADTEPAEIEMFDFLNPQVPRTTNVTVDMIPEVEADTSKAEEDIADMAERFGAIAAAFEVEADTEPAEIEMFDFLNPQVPRTTNVTVDMIPDWARLEAEARAMEIMTRLTPSWLPKLGARWGGVTAYAAGGIEAHVTGRQLIRYGEPETGGEAFIPRLGNLSRSEEIARIVAGWLGGAFVSAKELSKITGFAAGGVMFTDNAIANARPGSVMSSIAGATATDARPRGQGDIHIDNLVVKSGGTRGAIAMLRQAKKRRWLDDEEFDW